MGCVLFNGPKYLTITSPGLHGLAKHICELCDCKNTLTALSLEVTNHFPPALTCSPHRSINAFMLRMYIAKHPGDQVLQFLSMQQSSWLVSPSAGHLWKQVFSCTALAWQLSPVSSSLSTFCCERGSWGSRSVNSLWLTLMPTVLPKEDGWAVPSFSGRHWEPRECLLWHPVD